MKLGDKFSSYEEFEHALAVYKKSVLNEFWIRDARTLVTQRKRFPDTVYQCNYDLKYYYIKLACVKGGRPFKSRKINSLRKTSTVKQDCPASILLRLSKCKKYLIVVQIKDKHNHSSSENAFSSSSMRRAKLTEVKPSNVIKKKRVSAQTLCTERKFSIVDKHCNQMAVLCSQASMPIFQKRIELLKSIITLWSEGKDYDGEINLSAIQNAGNKNRQRVQKPTEIAETEQLVELPNDCKQLRVHIHVNIHPSLASKGNCPKPHQNNWQNADIKCEEEHEQEVLEATEEEAGQTVINETADQTEASEVYIEEEYLDNEFLPEDEYLEQEYLVDNDDEEENIPQLKNVTPPEVRKRGRPKGSTNTVKGLKRSKII